MSLEGKVGAITGASAEIGRATVESELGPIDVWVNIDAQQSDTRIVPSRRDDNLQSPPPGDPGAHGRFDRQAKRRSPQLWLATHKGALAGAAAGAAALGSAAMRGVRR